MGETVYGGIECRRDRHVYDIPDDNDGSCRCLCGAEEIRVELPPPWAEALKDVFPVENWYGRLDEFDADARYYFVEERDTLHNGSDASVRYTGGRLRFECGHVVIKLDSDEGEVAQNVRACLAMLDAYERAWRS